MATRRAQFPPELFEFLSDLAKHNDKAWFDANRARYDAFVKAPMLSFIGDFGSELGKVSEHFIADPRPNGGSMFRIHRDVRFSKDKSPYKTHTAAQFRHATGKDAHAPGFYLHLEPGEVMIGAGIWHPDPKALGRIRDAIVAKSDTYASAIKAVEKKGWKVWGESLARVPRGYDKEHPQAEALKRTDHVIVMDMGEEAAVKPGFMKSVATAYKSSLPLMNFLCSALDLAC